MHKEENDLLLTVSPIFIPTQLFQEIINFVRFVRLLCCRFYERLRKRFADPDIQKIIPS